MDKEKFPLGTIADQRHYSKSAPKYRLRPVQASLRHAKSKSYTVNQIYTALLRDKYYSREGLKISH